MWQLSRELCKKIHPLTKREPWRNDFRFKNQTESSSGSIMDNIAEGFERGGNKEFANFLRIARGSCGELKSQVIRALDKEYITREECKELYNLAGRISMGLKSLIDELNTSDKKGPNYPKKK